MEGLVALIAFIANIAFFFWFGSTLNSINRNLEYMAMTTKYTSDLTKFLADHAERQTRLLASIANAAERIPGS